MLSVAQRLLLLLVIAAAVTPGTAGAAETAAEPGAVTTTAVTTAHAKPSQFAECSALGSGCIQCTRLHSGRGLLSLPGGPLSAPAQQPAGAQHHSAAGAALKPSKAAAETQLPSLDYDITSLTESGTAGSRGSRQGVLLQLVAAARKLTQWDLPIRRPRGDSNSSGKDVVLTPSPAADSTSSRGRGSSGGSGGPRGVSDRGSRSRWNGDGDSDRGDRDRDRGGRDRGKDWSGWGRDDNHDHDRDHEHEHGYEPGPWTCTLCNSAQNFELVVMPDGTNRCGECL